MPTFLVRVPLSLRILLARKRPVGGPGLFDEDAHPRDNHGEFARKGATGGGLFGDDEPGGLFGGGGGGKPAAKKVDPADDFVVESHLASPGAKKKAGKIQERATDEFVRETVKPLQGQRDLFGADADDETDPHAKIRDAHSNLVKRHSGIVFVRDGNKFHTFGDHAARLKELGLSDSAGHKSIDGGDLSAIVKALVKHGHRVSVAEPRGSAKLSRVSTPRALAQIIQHTMPGMRPRKRVRSLLSRKLGLGLSGVEDYSRARSAGLQPRAALLYAIGNAEGVGALYVFHTPIEYAALTTRGK